MLKETEEDLVKKKSANYLVRDYETRSRFTNLWNGRADERRRLTVQRRRLTVRR